MADNEVEIYNAFCVAPSKLKPWYTFFYIDGPQYLADKLFAERGVSPIVIREHESIDGKYIGVTCMIRKKRLSEFLLAMADLQKNMIICGYTDYEEFCRSVLKEISEDDE